jgi:hypothetical protein
MKRILHRAGQAALAAVVVAWPGLVSAQSSQGPTNGVVVMPQNSRPVYQVEPQQQEKWEKPPWWKFWKRSPAPRVQRTYVPAPQRTVVPQPQRVYSTAEPPVSIESPGTAGRTYSQPMNSTSRKIWPPSDSIVNNPPSRMTPQAGAVPEESRLSAPATHQPHGGPTATPRLSSEELEQKVRIALGQLARDVRIAHDADGSLRVRVTAAGEGAEKLLIDKLTRVPELAVPEVKLEVMVNPQ